MGRWGEAAAVLIAGLSSPVTIILWPLYLRSGSRLLGIALVAATVQFVVTTFVSERSYPALPDLANLPGLVLIHAIAGPFVGSRILGGVDLEMRATEHTFSGGASYVIQSGDLTAGALTLRPVDEDIIRDQSHAIRSGRRSIFLQRADRSALEFPE